MCKQPGACTPEPGVQENGDCPWTHLCGQWLRRMGPWTVQREESFWGWQGLPHPWDAAVFLFAAGPLILKGQRHSEADEVFNRKELVVYFGRLCSVLPSALLSPPLPPPLLGLSPSSLSSSLLGYSRVLPCLGMWSLLGVAWGLRSPKGG